MSLDIKMELLQERYWQHYKFAKDLAFVMSIQNPRYIKIQNEVNNINKKIKELQKEIDSKKGD